MEEFSEHRFHRHVRERIAAILKNTKTNIRTFLALFALIAAIVPSGCHAGVNRGEAVQETLKKYRSLQDFDSATPDQLKRLFPTIYLYKGLAFAECGYANGDNSEAFFGKTKEGDKIIVLSSSESNLMLVNGHSCHYELGFESAASLKSPARIQSLHELSSQASANELKDVIELFEELENIHFGPESVYRNYRQGFQFALDQKNRDAQ